MKSNEFITETRKVKKLVNEGDDKNIDDVQANHPKIYRFMVERLGYLALNKQSTVEAYNTANSHMVVIKIKPSAGLGNTKAGLESDGIGYESMKSPMDGSEVLSGSQGEMHWTVTIDAVRGNMTATWRFALPHADGKTQTYHDRTMEGVDEGTRDLTREFRQVIQDYAEYATDDITEPSAPDTSKFRAKRSGMIAGVRDLHVAAPKYGFPRNFLLAIQVGGNVDDAIHQDIASEVKEIVTSAGLKYISTTGTSWSAYGASA